MKHSGSARRQRRQPYAWLGAGAVTLGIGAALAGGSAVAYADTGAGSGAGKASSASSESGSASSGSTTAKKAAAHSARPSTATSSGGNVSSRKAASAAASDAPEAAVVAVETPESAPATATAATPAAAHSARVKSVAETATSSSADSSSTAAAVSAAVPPSTTSWLPSEPPTVASVAVGLALGDIADAQAALQQQTWGRGNIAAGLVSIVPQVLLAQAALSLNTWQDSIGPTQSLYARTYGIPIVHELSGAALLGSVLLPTLATIALNSAGFVLPLVGALEGTGAITPVRNLVSTAALNGRVYGFVPVTMKSTTEPIVYISVNGGPSIPVLVDTGSSGLVLTRASVGDAAPLGAPTGTTTVRYSGDDTLLIHLTTYSTTVDFGSGIVSAPTSVDIVDDADAQKALDFFNLLGGASGVLGIGANSGGPGPAGLPTTSLPGDLSQGVFLYQGAFLGLAGVMIFGPNPMPTRATVSGAPDAYLNVKINNGSPTQVGAIIDSGGVYGTILSSMIGGGSYVPVGTRISVYTPDGVFLYSYIVTSQNDPDVITSGLINTGYVPYQQGPVYLDYTTPDRLGATHFDYR